MRNVFLWSLIIMGATALTTAVLADYALRHPSTMLGQCYHRVTGHCPFVEGSQAACKAADRQPIVELTPEATIQVMKDLGIVSSLADELTAPSGIGSTMEVVSVACVDDACAPRVPSPGGTSFPGITMIAMEDACLPQCPALSACAGGKSCTAGAASCPACPGCPKGSCCPTPEVAALTRAFEALIKCGKFEEAQAVAAQVTKLDPGNAWAATVSQITKGLPPGGGCGQCGNVASPQAESDCPATLEGVVEVVVVPPRMVHAQVVPPVFIPGFVQGCPPPFPMAMGAFIQRMPGNACEGSPCPTTPLTYPPGFVQGCPPPFPMAMGTFIQNTRGNACEGSPCQQSCVPMPDEAQVLAGIAACQASPTFLGQLLERAVRCCQEEDAETMTVETYDVGELLDASQGATEERLMQLVMRMVAPQSWDVQGGRASVDAYPLGGVLVVRQTAAAHEELGKFLAKLGSAVAAGMKKAPAKLGVRETCAPAQAAFASGCDAGRCAPGELVRIVYPVGDLVAALQPTQPGQATGEDRLLQVIRECVDPRCWDTAGGAGTLCYYPMGKSFVICQDAPCHHRIHLVLDHLRKLHALAPPVEGPAQSCELASQGIECTRNAGHFSFAIEPGEVEIEVVSPVDGKQVRAFRVTEGRVVVRVKRDDEGVKQAGFNVVVEEKTGSTADDRPFPGGPTDAPPPVKTPEQLPEAVRK